MLIAHLTQAATEFLALPTDPTTAPTGGPGTGTGGVNTTGMVKFLGTQIAPVLLAVLGVIFIGRAGRGEVSKVLTSSTVAVIGLAFMAGATGLFFFGDYLINIIFN